MFRTADILTPGIVCAISAALLLTISDIALKQSFRTVAPSVSYAISAVLGVTIWIPLALLLGGSFANFAQVLPYAVASAILSEAFYFYALSKGQLGITATLISTYPIYTILFSRVINDERLSNTQLALVMVVIIGTLMSALPAKTQKITSAIAWPIAAAIAIGLSDTMSKSIINETSAYDFIITLALVQVPVAAIYLRLEKQDLSEVFRFSFAITGALFAVLGTGLLWVSFEYTLASIASPIIATSSALVVLFAYSFLNERMRRINALGIALILIGVLGLSGA